MASASVTSRASVSITAMTGPMCFMDSLLRPTGCTYHACEACEEKSGTFKALGKWLEFVAPPAEPWAPRCLQDGGARDGPQTPDVPGGTTLRKYGASPSSTRPRPLEVLLRARFLDTR